MPRSHALWAAFFLAFASSACNPSTAPPVVAPAPAAGIAPTIGSTSTTPALLFDLPRAAEWSGVQMLLLIDLLANGETALDGQKVQTEADLVARLHRVDAEQPDLRAVVRAESSVPHGRVIHVLDLLKQAGIDRIAFGVTPVGDGAAPRPDGPGSTRDPFASLLPGQDWTCPFPAAADADSIDSAVVILSVAVDVTGKPRWARISQDPGHGFAQAAADCAMLKQYAAGRDGNGSPVQAMTPPIRIRFVR